MKEIRLDSPLNGELVELSQVNDPAFASGAMGFGAAVKNPDGKVYSPVDGEVTVFFETKHAIGIHGENGEELLIHVGLDTVSLNGAPFAYKVSEGETVKKGQLLMTADLAGIEAAGLKLHTPVLVTNTDDFVSVKVVKTGDVTPGDVVLSVV